MRKEFYEGSRFMAAKQMPWAAVICKVEGGYMGFESVTDYEIFKGQK